ncbi:hypothetical protein ACFOW1_09645 [Parasediminibacterium paludis]|uniref:Uncharacterized protein n=1 Tax=Parasediminibacterium paludis TaxID=908966 RepID=A0ABV8PYU2_9BACT
MFKPFTIWATALLIVFLLFYFCIPFSHIYQFFGITSNLIKHLIQIATGMLMGNVYTWLLFLHDDDNDDNEGGTPVSNHDLIPTKYDYN